VSALSGHIELLRARVERVLQLATAGVGDAEELRQERRALAETLERLRAVAERETVDHGQVAADRDTAIAALAQYRRLLEEGPDAYVVTDPSGLIREANAAASELLRVPRRFLIGKPLSAFVADSDLRAFRWRLNNVRQQERGEWPLRLRPRQGPSFLAGLTLGAMESHGTGPPDLRWFIRDISVRQRAEALEAANEFTREILDSEQRARTEAEHARQRLELLARVSGLLASSVEYPAALADIAPVVVPAVGDMLLIDLQRGPEFEPELSAHADPILSQRLESIRSGATALPPGHPVATVCRTGRPLVVPQVSDAWLESFAMTPEALTVWREVRLLSVVIVPIMSHRRRYGALTLGFGLSERHYDPAEVGFFTDVGLRVALALDTGHLVRELEMEHRRKDEFLAMLAHELRNPLAAVTSALAALDQATAEERHHLAEILGRQSQHLAHLVNDLLDISRIRFGLVSLHRQRVDLRDVVHQSVEIARGRKEGEGLSISARLAVQPVIVEADPDRLEQVLGNLLDNALKYTPAGGTIDVSLGIEGNHAVMHVRDSGVGIPLEFQPRVFDVFSRARIQGVEARGGLGLGLSVVRELISQHSGVVRVESGGLGQGADFEVRLPLAPPGPMGIRVEPRRAPAQSLSVLLVEDNDDARDSLRIALEQRGQYVRVARDGHEALREAQDRLPEVALIDIGLPDMDGYEVARAIRALPGGDTIRLIALTGFSAQHERSAAAGFDAHLVKPVPPQVLLSTLGGTTRD
jgi:PAS domain S-box-containing protein